MEFMITDGAQVEQWIARKSSRITKKWRKKSTPNPQGNFGSSKHEGNLCRPCHSYIKSVPIHKKNHSYYSWSFTKSSRFGSGNFQDGHKNASTLWPRKTTIWCFETLGLDDTSIDESVCSSRNSRLWWWMLVMLIHDGSTKKRSNIAKMKMWIMLFPSCSVTVWLYSKMSRIDEIDTYSKQ